MVHSTGATVDTERKRELKSARIRKPDSRERDIKNKNKNKNKIEVMRLCLCSRVLPYGEVERHDRLEIMVLLV